MDVAFSCKGDIVQLIYISLILAYGLRTTNGNMYPVKSPLIKREQFRSLPSNKGKICVFIKNRVIIPPPHLSNQII